MSLNGILDLLEHHPEFRRAIESAENGEDRAATVRQGARPAFIASLYRQMTGARRRNGPLLVIAPRPDDARRLHDQLLGWLGDDAPATSVSPRWPRWRVILRNPMTQWRKDAMMEGIRAVGRWWCAPSALLCSTPRRWS